MLRKSVGHNGISNPGYRQFNSVYFSMPRTGFQLVDISPWPIWVSVRILGVLGGALIIFCEGVGVGTLGFEFISVFLLIFSVRRWWSDVVLERTFLGAYRSYVVRNLQFGMYLFILSEVFFFVRFFWAFFHARVGELSIQGVGYWPPVGVEPIYP